MRMARTNVPSVLFVVQISNYDTGIATAGVRCPTMTYTVLNAWRTIRVVIRSYCCSCTLLSYLLSRVCTRYVYRYHR